MFEILMLLGFFYVGFCYLLPGMIPTTKSTLSKSHPNSRRQEATPARPNKKLPHFPPKDKPQHGSTQGRLADQRRLCKAGRLC